MNKLPNPDPELIDKKEENSRFDDVLCISLAVLVLIMIVIQLSGVV